MAVIATVAFEGSAEAQSTFFGARLVRDRQADTYLASSGTIPLAIDG